eukprot:scaffold27149_cov67-Phaeocystis_antarctica.AAC.4
MCTHPVTITTTEVRHARTRGSSSTPRPLAPRRSNDSSLPPASSSHLPCMPRCALSEWLPLPRTQRTL